MSLSTVRAQIASILEDNVSGIGEIHEFERYSREWSDYKDKFKPNDQHRINFVQILRPSFSREVNASSGNTTATNSHGVERVTHNFLLKGAYSLRDADESEKDCQDLIESICQQFRNRPTLGGYAEVVQNPIIGRIYNGMFGNVLCHIYEIEVSIREKNFF